MWTSATSSLLGSGGKTWQWQSDDQGVTLSLTSDCTHTSILNTILHSFLLPVWRCAHHAHIFRNHFTDWVFICSFMLHFQIPASSQRLWQCSVIFYFFFPISVLSCVVCSCEVIATWDPADLWEIPPSTNIVLQTNMHTYTKTLTHMQTHAWPVEASYWPDLPSSAFEHIQHDHCLKNVYACVCVWGWRLV